MLKVKMYKNIDKKCKKRHDKHLYTVAFFEAWKK